MGCVVTIVQRLSVMEARVASIESRLASFEDRLASLEFDVDNAQTQMADQDYALGNVDGRLTQLHWETGEFFLLVREELVDLPPIFEQG